MNTIQNLFQQAQLAEAAYADLTTAIGSESHMLTALNVANKDVYGGSFSTAQAAAFIADWTVVDQYTATETWLGTGFSATLFKNKQGQYSFAIRGSTKFNDFVADMSLVSADGIAVRQAVDMYNYWQRLTHQGTYAVAKLTSCLRKAASLPPLGAYGRPSRNRHWNMCWVLVYPSIP